MHAANKLGVKKGNVLASISGIGGVQAATIRKAIEVSIRPNFPSKFEITVEAYVRHLPNGNLTEIGIGWRKILQLAYPNYNVKANIDLGLGAKIFQEIIQPRTTKGNPLVAQKTNLGWLISGKVPIQSAEATTLVFNISTTEFHLETAPDEVSSANECEVIYESTVQRELDGRYAVTRTIQS